MNVEDFLAHYGVMGMKWGVRKAYNKANVQRLRDSGLSRRQAKATNRFQNRVDAQRMAATGRQGKVTVLKQLRNRAISNMSLGLGAVVRHPLSTKKAAQYQLSRNQETQAKIADGKNRVGAALLKLHGISIKDIDFSTTG